MDMRHSARSRRRAAVAGLFLLGAVLPMVGSAQAESGGDQPAQAADGDAVVRRDSRHDTSAPLRVLVQRSAREAGSRQGAEAEAGSRQPTRTLSRPPSPGHEADGALQTERIEPNLPSIGKSFEGIANVDQAPASQSIPSSTNGEAGINQYVQLVNRSMAVFSKTNGSLLLGPFPTNDIWADFGGRCEDSNRGDPIVLYDQIDDRWVISQFAFRLNARGDPVGPYFECIAVSQSPDATGSWHRYAFLIDNTELNDDPKLGVWPDAYYMGVNEFEQTQNFAYSGVKVVAFEREQMLTGAAAQSVIRQRGTATSAIQPFTLLPADLDGGALPPPGSPNYFVELDAGEFGGGDRLKIYEFAVNWADPPSSTFTGPTLLPVAPFDPILCGSGNCIHQPNGPRLDTLSDRLMFRNAYRNLGGHESIVVNHTVAALGNQAGVRWYELRSPGAAPVIHQQGTFAPGSVHRWMGSAAMDGDGNLAVGYSASSSSVHPSIRYAGRLANDPLGQLAQGENTLRHGTGSQTHPSARWGDYTDMTIDPVNDCTFWYTNQYYSATSATGWRTRIGSFKFPSCGPGDPTSTVSINNDQSLEGENPVQFTVSLSEPVDQQVTVNYATANGTAIGGSDYVAESGTVTFAALDTQETIDIVEVDDSAVEADEFFFVNLSGPTNVTIDDGQGLGTINNDDVACPGREGEAGNHIVGTAAGETLMGTGGRDIICGLGGSDVLQGVGGNDLLIGGDGPDRLEGGTDSDRLEGGTAADDLFGQKGPDSILGGAGNDLGHGQGGNDSLAGQKGNDALFGEAGNDSFHGGGGTDRCVQGPGSGARVACERFN
jgi:hypothetical protein